MECKKILDSKNYALNPTTHLDLTQNLETKNCHAERSEAYIMESKRDSIQHKESKSTQNRVRLAKQDAYIIEQNFAYPIMANGARRYAWVYPSDLSIKYNAEKAQAEIAFTLPSGAYATSFLSYIKNGDVREF